MKRTIYIPGNPVPQGGMRAFAVAGKAFTTATNPGPLALYRFSIQEEWGEPNPSDKPCVVRVTFAFKRPQSHYNTKGKLKGEDYKNPAPYYVTKKPDIDKVCRAVLDALSFHAYVDDSQVIELIATKVYADEPGTTITVHDLYR